MYVHSNLSNSTSYILNNLSDVLFVIPIISGFNAFEIDSATVDFEVKNNIPDQLQSMTFRLTDENNNIIDLNNYPWSFSIVLTYGQ